MSIILDAPDNDDANQRARTYLRVQRRTAFVVNMGVVAVGYGVAAAVVTVPLANLFIMAGTSAAALSLVMFLRMMSQNAEIARYDAKSLPVTKYAIYQTGGMQNRPPILEGIWDGFEHASTLYFVFKPVRQAFGPK